MLVWRGLYFVFIFEGYFSVCKISGMGYTYFFLDYFKGVSSFLLVCIIAAEKLVVCLTFYLYATCSFLWLPLRFSLYHWPSAIWSWTCLGFFFFFFLYSYVLCWASWIGRFIVSQIWKVIAIIVSNISLRFSLTSCTSVLRVLSCFSLSHRSLEELFIFSVFPFLHFV